MSERSPGIVKKNPRSNPFLLRRVLTKSHSDNKPRSASGKLHALRYALPTRTRIRRTEALNRRYVLYSPNAIC